MNWLRGLVTSRLAGPIGAGVSLILALSLGFVVLTKNATIAELRRDKATLTADLSNARADLQQCRANRITLEDAANRQSSAVAVANAAGAKRLEALGGELVKAEASTKAATARAAALLARKGSTCNDADALIMEATR